MKKTTPTKQALIREVAKLKRSIARQKRGRESYQEHVASLLASSLEARKLSELLNQRLADELNSQKSKHESEIEALRTFQLQELLMVSAEARKILEQQSNARSEFNFASPYTIKIGVH